jgi:proteic killer suppression protein
MAIKRFANVAAEKVFGRERVKSLGPEVSRAALRKLLMVHAAASLNDLRVPPGNRLEALSGDRAGQYSIRINDQFRVCFRWADNNAHDVEIGDYH